MSYYFIMLPREYRLKKRSAFNATYRTGKTFYYDGVTVFCGKQKKDNISTKIGFVVSKKIHKRAVKRNRIKRLMRETCRLYIKEHKGLPLSCMSIIFVASTKVLSYNFKEMDYAIKTLLEKICND